MPTVFDPEMLNTDWEYNKTHVTYTYCIVLWCIMQSCIYEWFCDISVYPNVLGVYLRPISRGCNIPQPASQLRKARTLQIHDPVWEAGKSGTPKSWQVDSDKNVEWDESSGKNLGSFCQKWVETKCFDQNKVGLHGLHPFFINLFLTKQGWGHSQP